MILMWPPLRGSGIPKNWWMNTVHAQASWSRLILYWYRFILNLLSCHMLCIDVGREQLFRSFQYEAFYTRLVPNLFPGILVVSFKEPNPATIFMHGFVRHWSQHAVPSSQRWKDVAYLRLSCHCCEILCLRMGGDCKSSQASEVSWAKLSMQGSFWSDCSTGQGDFRLRSFTAMTTSRVRLRHQTLADWRQYGWNRIFPNIRQRIQHNITLWHDTEWCRMIP